MTSSGPIGARALRVGLIGCGKMGLQHLKAIRTLANVEIVGVADPVADREALAPLLPPGAEILADVGELLDRLRPDVVHIVTPPGSHAALARRAIEAGCHVYVGNRSRRRGPKPKGCFHWRRSTANSSVPAISISSNVRICSRWSASSPSAA